MQNKLFIKNGTPGFSSIDGVFFFFLDYSSLDLDFDYLQFDEDRSIKIKDSKVIDLTSDEILIIESFLTSIVFPENYSTFGQSYEQMFLLRTDWLIMRHNREKDLNIETTLSEDDYFALQNERHLKSKRI